MRKQLLFLLCIIYSSIIYIHSQEVADATIYFHNSDSQPVKIMRPNDKDNYNERIVIVKKKAISITDSKWVTDTIYYPKDIKGFTLQRYKEVYLSENLNGQALFLKEIVNDEDIKVFSKLSGNSESFYVKISDKKELVEINSDIEPYKGILIKRSKLDPKVFNKIQLNEVDLHNGFKAANKNNHKYLASPFQLGIMLGYNRAVLPKTKDKIGDDDNVFLVGVYANFNIESNPKFNLRPELYYSKDEYISNPTLSRKSLTLPLIVRYSVIDVKEIIPYLEFGPSVNFRISADKYKYLGNSHRVKEDTTPIYFGVAAGLGAEIPITYKYSIYAGFRYHYTYMDKFNINNWMFTISGNIF